MLVNNGRLVKIARPEVMFKDKTFLKIMSPPSDKKGMLRRIAAKAHIRECGEKEERILNIKNLNFKYPNNVPALRDVNLAVNKGDFIGIVGLNGSGKSTLALNIIGLLKGKGKMLFEGNDISKQDVYERTKNIGYVFQNSNYQLFEENVSREIAFGLKNLNLHAKEIKKRVQDALKMINLVEMAKIDPHILSIGQKRRVTIASILSMLPKLLIIDEPDTGLDYKNAKNLMEHINKLNAIGCTIVLISHNLELVSDYCNKIIYLEDGEIKDINRFLNRQIA